MTHLPTPVAPGSSDAPGSTGAVELPAAVAPTPRPSGALWRRGVWVRTWKEFGYLSTALLLAPFGLFYVLGVVGLSAGLAVTLIGLFVPGYLVIGGRAWGAMYRGMARGMLGTEVPAPLPFRHGRGFWRSLGSVLGDAAGWRAIAFLVLVFPLALLSFVLSVTFLALALGGTTHWIWSRSLPVQRAADGSLHRGAQLWTDYFMDTPLRQLVLVLVGLVALLIWHRVTLAMAHLFRLLTGSLLGPTRGSQRMAHLEQTRGSAVQDADARLRRIERDLHDGTQARLVAVAMQVGEARDQMATDGEMAAGLLDEAHAALKETLAELREIARGIHPPALDNGLAVALETLAARSPLPVTVDVDLDRAPAPEVETIGYFAVAELLANVVRHSGASGAYVRAETVTGLLRIRVRDDGRGGARPSLPGASGGTGLHGLAERVATVDGDLDIVSPVGGPTVVTVHLPMSLVR